MTLKFIELIAGIGLFYVAVAEILQTLDESGVGLHHGLAMFALTQIIKALLEIFESLKTVNHAFRANQATLNH